MTKLKSNYTTIVQSDRLLKYGLPANSADCYRYRYNDEKRVYKDRRSKLVYVLYGHKYSREVDIAYQHAISVDMVPCWSTGRLMELDMLYRKNEEMSDWSFCRKDPRSIKDFVVKVVCERLKNNEYEFPKFR